MGRLWSDTVDRLRPFGHNLPLDLCAAIGVGVSATLVGVLLPTIARREGLHPLGLAALAAAPFVGNMVGVFAGRLGPHSTRHFALLRLAGAGALLALPVSPIPIVLIATSYVFHVSLGLGSPFQVRLWGVAYPARVLGRVVGFLGMGRSAAGALTALIGGVVADRLGGPTAVALAGLVGGGCALAYFWYRAPATSAMHRYSAHESLRLLRERPTVQRLGLALAFWGGGFIAAGPLLPLVNVDRLDLSLSQVGVLGVLGAVSTTVAFPAWGAVADRFGAFAPICVGGVVSVVGLLGYALAQDVAVLWFASLAFGVGGSALEVSVVGVISRETMISDRAATMGGFNAVLSARGIVTGFVMAGLVQAEVVDVTVGLLLCVATSAIGVGLFWWAAQRASGTPSGMRMPRFRGA